MSKHKKKIMSSHNKKSGHIEKLEGHSHKLGGITVEPGGSGPHRHRISGTNEWTSTDDGGAGDGHIHTWKEEVTTGPTDPLPKPATAGDLQFIKDRLSGKV